MRFSSGRRAAAVRTLAVVVACVVTAWLAASCSSHRSSSPVSAEATGHGLSRESAPPPAVVVNSTGNGEPVQRFDTDDNAVDAHDGQISQFDDDYYLFGTAYGCGFTWTKGGFCGINVYRSADLVAWTRLGTAFDPDEGDWQRACTVGCFRPHVVEVNGRYVMWLNVANKPGASYRVLTAPSPAGPYAFHPGEGRTAVVVGGDENLFVDDDGAGYIAMTDIAGAIATRRSHEIVIQRLSPDGLNAVGALHRLPNVGLVEAPTMWKVNGRYHLAISDPACPYCTGTGTTVFDSSASPLDGWGAGYQVSEKSCRGQITHVSTLTVAGRSVSLYQSDRWVKLVGDRITFNQSLASQAWVPLTYTPAGRVADIGCTSEWLSEADPAAVGRHPLVPAGSSLLGPGALLGEVLADAAGNHRVTVWVARQQSAAGILRVRIVDGSGRVLAQQDANMAAWNSALTPLVMPEVSFDSPATVLVQFTGKSGLVALGSTRGGYDASQGIAVRIS